MKRQATNPVLPGYEYIPDAEPRVFGGRVYLYGSHDRFDGGKFCMNDYVTWSAPVDDLSDWRYEGVIFRKSDDPSNPDSRNALWAPDVVQGPDGAYYLYYCLEGDTRRIGIARSEAPTGKFAFHGYLADKTGAIVGERPGDTIPFDPAVLVDDDGRVWLYSGNAPYAPHMDENRQKASVVMELEPDMKTIRSEPRRLIPLCYDSAGTGFEGHEFFEASSIRKIGGRYYFVYSSVQLHELCYAVSDHPDREFRYAGALVSNGDFHDDGFRVDFNMKPNPALKNYIGNNHGGLCEAGGKYYIFYHRQTNRHMFSRQVCAEEVALADGAFRRAGLTSCGPGGGPLAGHGAYEARIACHLFSKDGAVFSSGPQIQNNEHPAFTQDRPDMDAGAGAAAGPGAPVPFQYIENMRDGATAGFRYFDFRGASGIVVTVRGECEGIFTVRDGLGESANTVAEVLLQPCESWHDCSAPLCIPDGVHPLYFTFTGTGAVDFGRFAITNCPAG
ncbi:MAG: family 43 glycosylhydrolase [Lachnospiraceae bacterium]|nr:family 43 glycosylhydrolase [Lachnospiraceae bacterium]